MISRSLTALVLLLAVSAVWADVYMHNPRGSNDRLNEQNANRQNANRVYDSQDNAKGGYAWGPSMHYYTGSELEVQWTNQHECGASKSNCEVILQYACADSFRDGTTTTRVPDNAEESQDPQYGIQETYAYYQDCKNRERNKGLFIADKNPINSARGTRQNPGGTRHGFECPEERDYYPYWHGTVWKDIAVFTNNVTKCEYYQTESQNVKDKSKCSDPKYNNEDSCKQNGGSWESVDAHGIEAPDCKENFVNTDNHLGFNSEGKMNNYLWQLPAEAGAKCVLRIRYNISTTDFEQFATDAANNNKASPVLTDPMPGYQKDGAGTRNLSLALNTNQYGRTFQDRSFLFEIRERPSEIPADTKIFNYNVRGKRGNIVQSYPAVEYDFVPNKLETKEGEYVHFQWTGSNYNANNGNNNAEGTDGTDRNNMVQVEDLGASMPLPFGEANFFEDADTREGMAHVDQKDCLSYEELMTKNNNNQNNVEDDTQNCMKLNGAEEGYFNGGLLKMNNTGEYYFMSTRNNNFSNRGQKGTIVVNPFLPTWAWILIGVAAGLLVMGAAGTYAYKQNKLPLFNNNAAAAGAL